MSDTLTGQQFVEYIERAEADLRHWKTRAEVAERERDQMEADCRETADRANLWETRAGIAEARIADLEAEIEHQRKEQKYWYDRYARSALEAKP
jgi:hypothetical protein